MKRDGAFVWMSLRIPPDRLLVERFDPKAGVRKEATGWRLKVVREDPDVAPPDDAEAPETPIT
jgi:hypothetical protein